MTGVETAFRVALDDAALDYLEHHEMSFEFRDGAEWARTWYAARAVRAGKVLRFAAVLLVGFVFWRVLW